MVEGWTPISVTVSLNERLRIVYDSDRKRPDNQKFSAWLNNLLFKYVEFSEELGRYGPFLEFKDADGNMVNLYDHRTNEPITVYLDGLKKQLKCGKDRKFDCLHVGFCFAIPEVYKVLIDNGFKEPKKRV